MIKFPYHGLTCQWTHSKSTVRNVLVIRNLYNRLVSSLFDDGPSWPKQYIYANLVILATPVYLSVIVLQLQVHLYSFVCHLQVVSHGTIACML